MIDSLNMTIPGTVREMEVPDEQVHTLKLRGSTVVDIAPRIIHPTRLQLYEREALKQAGPAPLRQVRRFVAERVVRGW